MNHHRQLGVIIEDLKVAQSRAADDLSYWAKRRGEWNDAISPRPDTALERIAAAICIAAMIAAAVAFACT